MPSTNQLAMLSQPIYDTVEVAASGTSATFFATAYGGTIGSGTKTKAETNLVNVGKLDQGQTFEIRALSLFAREQSTRITFADQKAFMQGSFTLEIGQTKWLECPIAMIPSGGAELQYFSNITAAATEFQVNRGVPVMANRLMLDIPVKIKEFESISAVVKDFTLTAASRFTLVLWGILTRPAR